MGELVELDVTTVEESVTVNVTQEGAVQISVVAETGPAGPAGPNSVTSATTSDGTAELEVLTLEAVDGISTSGENAPIATNGENASIYTNGSGASIYTSGSGASIATGGENASIYTSGEFANIYTDSPSAHIQTRGTFKINGGDYTTTLSATQGVADQSIAFPDRSGTVALTEDYTDGTATIDVLDATVQGTLTADHIHGNLAGSVYAHIRAGENLAKGDPVYISGSHGSGANLIAIVSKADAANAAKMPAVGVMDAAVTSQSNGHMVITGTITELNTNAFAVNTVLYVATGGGWTSTPPAANSQAVAIVERSNANNGAVIVKVNGLASTPIDPVRTTVTGNGATSVYAIGGATGLTNPSALIVAIDGVLQEPNADYTVSGGNITFTDPLANGAKAVIVSPTNTIQVGQVTPSDGSVTSAKIVAGVTLTSPSIAGTAAFTSTTRPTSAGTGTPAATSLITRADGDARYGDRVQFVMTADATITSATHANVTGATVALEASSNYSFEGFIHVEALAALSRIQCRFAYTGTLQTVQGAINCAQPNGSTFPIAAGAFLTTSFADVSSFDRAFYISGFIRTNAAGTLTMTATRVSGSGSPLIKAGTQIRFTKL